MSETDTALPDFVYEALPDPESYIRLLKVQKAGEEDPVSCTLSTWPIDSAPSYRSVSYTWGDPAATAIVTVNDCRVRVRKHCEYVLRQASWYDPDGFYWIDAICINQLDLDEKGKQVQMMGSIFRGAVEVLACVGAPANDSEFLFRFLYDYQDILEKAFLVERRVASYAPAYGQTRTTEFGTLYEWLTEFTWTRKRLSKALNELVNRAYFSRVWVLQELFCVPKVSICCGKRYSYPRLLRGLDYLETSELNATNFPIFNIIFQHEQLPAEIWWEEVFQLQCEDPRDILYGTLGVIEWNGSQSIQPDYTRSTFEVAEGILENSAQYFSRQDVFTHDEAVSFTKALAAAFRLTVDDASVRQQLILRRTNFSDLPVPATVDRGRLDKVIRIPAFAAPLRSDDFRDLEDPPAYQDPQQPSHYSLCESAQVDDPPHGDWELQRQQSTTVREDAIHQRARTTWREWLLYTGPWSLGLVLREVDDGHHDIIGFDQRIHSEEAFAEFVVGSKIKYFDVFFAANDLLIFAVLSTICKSATKTQQAEILERYVLPLQVCCSTRSSFARERT